MVKFPAPVGGTPLPLDFVPSVLFSALYAALVPLVIYRLVNRRSRTTLLLGTLGFVIERSIIYALRAAQAKEPESRHNPGLLDYMQISLAMGYIGIVNDLNALLRCLLINPTYGSDRYPESPAAATKEYVVSPPMEGTEDMPRIRYKVRRFTDTMGFVYFASLGTAIAANSVFQKAMESQGYADAVYALRLASAAVGILFTGGIFVGAMWGKRRLERISMRGASVASLVAALMVVVVIYRLAIMPLRVTSLDDHALTNTPRGKAAFYICHILPEWLASATIFGVQTRKIFGTGPCGDVRWADETEAQKTKRLAKEAKKAEKKAAKSRTSTIDVEIIEKAPQLIEKFDTTFSPVRLWSFN